MDIQTTTSNIDTRRKPWLKRLAWLLPLFFLVKGLMWLVIPALGLMYTLQ